MPSALHGLGDAPLEIVAKHLSFEAPAVYVYDAVTGRKLVTYCSKVIDERTTSSEDKEYLLDFFGSRPSSWHSASEMLSCETLVSDFHRAGEPASDAEPAGTSSMDAVHASDAEGEPDGEDTAEAAHWSADAGIADDDLADTETKSVEGLPAATVPVAAEPPATEAVAAEPHAAEPSPAEVNAEGAAVAESPPAEVSSAEVSTAAAASSGSSAVEAADDAPPVTEPPESEFTGDMTVTDEDLAALVPPSSALDAAIADITGEAPPHGRTIEDGRQPESESTASSLRGDGEPDVPDGTGMADAPAAPAEKPSRATTPTTTRQAGGRRGTTEAPDATAPAASVAATSGVQAAAVAPPTESTPLDPLIRRAERRIRSREAALEKARAQQEALSQRVRQECREFSAVEAAARAREWLASASDAEQHVRSCEGRVEEEAQPLRAMITTYRDAYAVAKRRRIELPAAQDALRVAIDAHEAAMREEAAWATSVEAAIAAASADLAEA